MNLPILPMGTLMAVAMMLAALALLGLPPHRHRVGTMRLLEASAGALALPSGMWQLLWYAPRHLATHWGQMSILSGIALLGAAALLLSRGPTSTWRHVRWPLAVVLAVLGSYYLVSIIRL